MKKILVTGGAGFIGSHTVIELLNAGYEPVILDNFSNSEPFIIDRLKELSGFSSLKVYEVDCTDYNAVEDVFSKESFDGVIHFAARKAVGESFSIPLEYHFTNLNSLNVVLASMKKFKVSHLVFSSSCTVYGNAEDSPVTEDSIKNSPTSPYGRSKAFSEAIIQDAHRADDSVLSAVLLRYFNPIGAHPSAQIGELPLGPPNNLVPYITQTAAGLRECLTIFGNDYNTEDGTCVRDYIHVVDVAKAHVSALSWIEKQPRTIDSFNLGSGKGDSVLKVVNTFKSVNQVELKTTIGPRRIGDVTEVYADPSKAKNVLGWQTEYSLEDALKHAWKWQESLKK